LKVKDVAWGGSEHKGEEEGRRGWKREKGKGKDRKRIIERRSSEHAAECTRDMCTSAMLLHLKESRKRYQKEKCTIQRIKYPPSILVLISLSPPIMISEASQGSETRRFLFMILPSKFAFGWVFLSCSFVNF
jgi:hypothetical protein